MTCSVCCDKSPDYLVVWPDEEEWICEECFEHDILGIARQAEAAYYLPTCAQVKLTVKIAEIHPGEAGP